VITAGQRGDSPQFQAVLDAITVPRPGRGGPRTRPGRVLADKAYGSRANRSYLRRRGIRCTIPEKADQVRNRKNKGRAGGRPPAFDPQLYRQRHAVETSKPQCCHICDLLASSSAPSLSGVVPGCWFFSQGRRLCCPRGVWCRVRRRSTSAGSARTTISLMAGCR
jgi:Transposase DDE domain